MRKNKKFKQMPETLSHAITERVKIKKEILELLKPVNKLRSRLRMLTNTISYNTWYIKNNKSKGKI